MTPEMQKRFDQLVGSHLDGALDAERTRELAELLAADGDARRAFARALAMDTALPQALPRRRPALLLWSTAAAALLAIGVGWWLLRHEHGPRIEGPDAIVLRDGRELPVAAAGSLRTADRIRTAGSPAVLRWSEGTHAILAPAGTLDLLAAGPDKALHLDTGRLEIDAAPQGAERRLRVTTADLAASVIGTRFRIARQGGASSLAVEHGSVAVEAGSERRTISAGQLAVRSADRPMWVSQPGQDLQALFAEPVVRLDAAACARDRGAGWIGRAHDGSLVAIAEATAERIANPHRDTGYTSLMPGLVIDADITLGQPATVAVFLICRRPDGRDWIGNYAVKIELPAGRHRRSWNAADLAVEKGAPLTEALGGRIAMVAVSAWPTGAGLRLHGLDIAHAVGR